MLPTASSLAFRKRYCKWAGRPREDYRDAFHISSIGEDDGQETTSLWTFHFRRQGSDCERMMRRTGMFLYACR